MEALRVSALIAAAVPIRDSYEIARWPEMKPPMSMIPASALAARALNPGVGPDERGRATPAYRRGEEMHTREQQ